MEKKVKAIFRGQNGSLGYETNKEYLLTLEHKRGNSIYIHTTQENKSNNIVGNCEYESMVSFLNNWDNIITLN